MYCIACGAQNGDQDKFCNRCGKPLVTSAAAAAAVVVSPSVPAAPSAAYRSGNRLVVPKGAPLPGYCVKCAQPAAGEPIKKIFFWHNPWIFLVALISPIIYIIVAVIVRKRAELMIPVCDEHRQRRKNMIIATWILVLGFIPAGILVGSLISDSDTAGGVGILTSTVLLIAAFVTGAKAATLRPREITDSSATFSGVGEQFLALLPSR